MENTSILSFFFNADLVVKTVMLILLAASVWSWTIILQRGLVLKRVSAALTNFEKMFWAGQDLTELYQRISDKKSTRFGLESIFYSGFKEFARLQKHKSINSMLQVEGVTRAMRVAVNKEEERLQKYLPVLATIGSISPYIGLFGTVWGIMTSFQALGSVQQATIAMVAPGISEALIATAMGLFAAIPAVIAFNRYSNGAAQIVSQYDNFQDELTNIINRQLAGQLTVSET